MILKRGVIAGAVLLLGVLGTIPPARSQSASYRVELAPIGHPSGQKIVLSCSTTCKGQIDIPIDGAWQPATVVAAIFQGYLHLQLATAGATLFINSQPYRSIPVGPPSLGEKIHTTLTVTEPTQAALDDSDRLYRRPVMRGAGSVVVRIDVDIQPE